MWIAILHRSGLSPPTSCRSPGALKQKNGTYVHNIQTDIQSSPHPTGVAMFGIIPDRRSQSLGLAARSCLIGLDGVVRAAQALAVRWVEPLAGRGVGRPRRGGNLTIPGLPLRPPL